MSNKETASPKGAERKCSCDGRVSKLESIVYAMQRMLGKIDPEDVRKSEQDEALAVSRKGGWVHTGLLVSLCAVMMAFTAFAGADKAVFVGVEGEDVSIVLDADQGDDAADTWRITAQADNDLSFTNATTEVVKFSSAGAVSAIGAVSGEVNVSLDTTATVTLTADNNAATGCKGNHHYNNDADVIKYILPAVEAGLVVTIGNTNLGASNVITIEVDDADIIVLDGAVLDAGDTIDSPSAAGASITLIGLDAVRWLTINRTTAWIDGGAS